MKKKNYAWVTWVTVLVIALLIAGIFLLLRQKSRQNQPDYLSGEGYQQMVEVDGKLYLVDGSGDVYTMDWDTGETTLVVSGPEDVSWVSDGNMERLYYFWKETLYEMTVANGQEQKLAEVPGASEVLAATEHYVTYRKTEAEQEKICCLGLDTMETRVLDVAGENFMLGDIRASNEEEILYVTCCREYEPGQIMGAGQLEAWDLTTGEITVLTKTSGLASLWDNGFIYENYVYYVQSLALWRVSLDGGDDEFVWAGGMPNIPMGFTADSLLLVGSHNTAQEPIVALVDPETGNKETIHNFGDEPMAFRKIYTNGMRFAVLYYSSGNPRIFLGDMPDEKN